MLPECLDQLVGGENSKVLAKPIGRLTDKVLGKWWRKIIQAGRRIDSLSAAERHEMRKRLKTMRYAVEFLASLYPAKDVRRFTKKLRSLQDKFGYLNDVVVAEKLKLVRADGTSDPGLQRAGGYVIGWHAARAERAWKISARVGSDLQSRLRFGRDCPQQRLAVELTPAFTAKPGQFGSQSAGSIERARPA